MSCRSKAEPYCDCQTAKLNARKQKQAKQIVVTESCDGETCDYCGYYVQWRKPESLHWNWLATAETGREETRNPYDPESWRLM